MSLFQKLYEGASKSNSIVKGLSASVKLTDESGSVSMSAKEVVGKLEGETPLAVSKLLNGSESVKIGRKMKFEKSSANVGFTATGKFAAEKFLEHEGVKPEVPGDVAG